MQMVYSEQLRSVTATNGFSISVFIQQLLSSAAFPGAPGLFAPLTCVRPLAFCTVCSLLQPPRLIIMASKGTKRVEATQI